MAEILTRKKMLLETLNSMKPGNFGLEFPDDYFRNQMFNNKSEMGSQNADGCPGSEADGVFLSDPLAAKIRRFG